MTETNLNAVMGTLAQLPLDKAAITYGVPQDDLRLLMDKDPWHSPQMRLTVRRSLEAIAMGALDMLGLPRIELPAELIAQWIAVLVSPVNWMPASAFFGRPRTIDQIIEHDDVQLPGLTPHRIHAMVIRIAGANHAQRRAIRQQCLAAIGAAPELPEGEHAE